MACSQHGGLLQFGGPPLRHYCGLLHKGHMSSDVRRWVRGSGEGAYGLSKTHIGPKYEYLWADGVKYKKPIKVSAPEYVDLLMGWIENQINNPAIFPLDDGKNFPKNFKTIVKTIFKRLLRVYGHIYHSHIQKYVQLDAESHLNSCFKHFLYFIEEFQLVDQRELQPLMPLIEVMKKKDNVAQKKYKPKFQPMYKV